MNDMNVYSEKIQRFYDFIWFPCQVSGTDLLKQPCRNWCFHHFPLRVSTSNLLFPGRFSRYAYPSNGDRQTKHGDKRETWGCSCHHPSNIEVGVSANFDRNHIMFNPFFKRKILKKNIWLVVSTLLLWKIWVRQLGLLFPTIGENKSHVPNHQPVLQISTDLPGLKNHPRGSTAQRCPASVLRPIHRALKTTSQALKTCGFARGRNWQLIWSRWAF